MRNIIRVQRPVALRAIRLPRCQIAIIPHRSPSNGVEVLARLNVITMWRRTLRVESPGSVVGVGGIEAVACAAVFDACASASSLSSVCGGLGCSGREGGVGAGGVGLWSGWADERVSCVAGGVDADAVYAVWLVFWDGPASEGESSGDEEGHELELHDEIWGSEYLVVT